MADTKQRVLRELYYDEGGFMSTANLYKDAKRVKSDIMHADVKEWLANQTSTQTLGKQENHLMVMSRTIRFNR